MREHRLDAKSVDIQPPLDDAAVEAQLRFHQRINRATWLISGILLAEVTALYLGAVPIALRAFVRPVLVFGVTLLFALEAWRHLGHGRQSGRLRWTRLTMGACLGALAIGEALRHIWPSVDPTAERVLGIGVSAIAIALVCDLREFRVQSPYSSLARVGIVIGAVGAALMGATLLGEPTMPFVWWWRLLLGSALLIAIAGGIYLRVHSVMSHERAHGHGVR